MSRVKIVTNAVCDLTPETASLHQIEMIPEALIFGSTPYLSNIDLSPQMLYEKMRCFDKLPTGSHPNVSMYMDAFRTAGEAFDQVLCLNMTSKMSGSINTAFVAKNMLEEEGFAPEIFIYDTLALSHGLGFLVLEAARLAEEGQDAQSIMAYLDTIRDKLGVYFVMKSLQNAQKGGRLGLIRTVAADALGVKPVLMFRNGIVSEVGLVRKFKAALNKLVETYDKRAKKGGRVVVFHANNEPEARLVKEDILALDPDAQVSVEWLGGGIGIYTGEGAIGITFWE